MNYRTDLLIIVYYQMQYDIYWETVDIQSVHNAQFVVLQCYNMLMMLMRMLL